MRSRVSFAAIAGCLGAVLVYAVVRCGQKILFPEPDPALVFYSPHAGFFWRCWIAAYAGGTLAFLGWLAAGRAPERVARFLARAVVVSAVVASLQSLLLP